jgi:hypothetical protein
MWGSKTSRFNFSAQKPVEQIPKPVELVFKKLRTAFWLTQQTDRKKWTVQKPVEPVSTRLKTGWVSGWAGSKIGWLFLNTIWTSLKTNWTSIWIPAEPAWKPAEPVFSREQFWPR